MPFFQRRGTKTIHENRAIGKIITCICVCRFVWCVCSTVYARPHFLLCNKIGKSKSTFSITNCAAYFIKRTVRGAVIWHISQMAQERKAPLHVRYIHTKRAGKRAKRECRRLYMPFRLNIGPKILLQCGAREHTHRNRNAALGM